VSRRLDGNAIAGDLMEVFGSELTVAWAVCRSCGAHDPLAELHVYRDAPGIVGRCCRCEAVLLRIVRAPGRTYVDLGGIASLELQSSPSQ
jgi:hypothetical protein